MAPDSPPLPLIRTGQKIALLGLSVSFLLALTKIVLGRMAGSTAVLADGFESGSDVLTSAFIIFGLAIAARPPDHQHPYGHGRVEMLAGLAVGVMLAGMGLVIVVQAMRGLAEARPLPEAFAVWPVSASIVMKSLLSVAKFRVGRRIQSGALVADAWNDAVDVLSGITALAALGLNLIDPEHFGHADQVGGIAVGCIIVATGIRVVRSTALDLMDTMPSDARLDEIRSLTRTLPGVRGIEKLFARKTGLQYHVDLHLEVDPELTVRQAHEIAHQVQRVLRQRLEWVADVLIHIEPAP